jgi:dTDP-4-dehydrorhamnose reductase
VKVLITGAAGQLGQALRRSVPSTIGNSPVELISTSRTGGEGVIRLDLADAEACRALVEQLRPDWLINAGAYTAVDKAERESELAQAVNAGAPAAFAQALQLSGGRLLQVSTDFVFNGLQGSPYQPEQLVDPLGVYGASKAAGETRAAAALAADRLCILRTSWVYGPVGRNFLLTMLHLMAEREQLGVVADQVGCPTSTAGLARACWAALQHSVAGTHHWSDAGAASWYDFAMAIRELALSQGLLQRAAAVQPLTTADYPTPARRPSYSLLDCTASRIRLALEPCHWREALADVLRELEVCEGRTPTQGVRPSALSLFLDRLYGMNDTVCAVSASARALRSPSPSSLRLDFTPAAGGHCACAGDRWRRLHRRCGGAASPGRDHRCGVQPRQARLRQQSLQHRGAAPGGWAPLASAGGSGRCRSHSAGGAHG